MAQQATEGAARGARARSLTGERAVRIIEAMRASVAEVGIAGSTFERVAGKAGVSRGLLHYYFGTKERLLVEVVRRDTEQRVEQLVAMMREARTPDELIAAMSVSFDHYVSETQDFVSMVPELYVAARNSPELKRELGALYSTARRELVRVLREKQEEGVIRLRFDAEATFAYMAAAGEGLAVQRLIDPTLPVASAIEAGSGAARWLFSAG